MLITKFLYSNNMAKRTNWIGSRTHKKKVSAEAEVKTDWKAVMTNYFIFYRKKYVQGKRLQSGGPTFKWKYELK